MPHLRQAWPSDLPFVVDSWLNSYRMAPRARDMGDVYFAEQKAIVRRLCNDAGLVIACDAEDPEAILGWLCATNPPNIEPDPVVHYVYVRAAGRRCGVARRLLEAFLTHPCTYTHRPAHGVLPIPDSWTYNPERIYR